MRVPRSCHTCTSCHTRRRAAPPVLLPYCCRTRFWCVAGCWRCGTATSKRGLQRDVSGYYGPDDGVQQQDGSVWRRGNSALPISIPDGTALAARRRAWRRLVGLGYLGGRSCPSSPRPACADGSGRQAGDTTRRLRRRTARWWRGWPEGGGGLEAAHGRRLTGERRANYNVIHFEAV